MVSFIIMLLTSWHLLAQPQIRSSVNTMYLCLDCQESLLEPMVQFYGAYEQMTVNKKNVIAIGEEWNLVMSKEAYTDKDQKRLKFFTDKKIPYAKINELGNYELLRPHRNRGDSKEQIKKNLISYFKQMDKTQPLVIHIGGHGWNEGRSGEGSLPPEKAGIALYRPGSQFERPSNVILTHEELAQIMTDAGLAGPGAPPVRIVAEHCYGGGVHWISKKFSNVCSASFSSHKDVYWFSEQLSKQFWENYNKMYDLSVKPSLSDTFMSVYAFRERNEGASLSSMDYVRQTLEKHGIASPKEEGYKDWYAYLHDTSIAPEDKCEYLGAPVTEDRSALSSLMKGMNEVFSSTDLTLGLWKDHGIEVNPYIDALEDLSQNEIKDKKLMEEYRLRLAEKREAWDFLEQKQKNNSQREWNSSLTDFLTWLGGDLKTEVEASEQQIIREKELVLKEFEAFKKKNLSRIVNYLENKDKVRLMKEASAFHQLYKQGKIGKNEMDTYKRMLKCEALPL